MKRKIFVLVIVWRGLISKVEAFKTEEEAEKREEEIKKGMDFNPQDDESGIFEIEVDF